MVLDHSTLGLENKSGRMFRLIIQKRFYLFLKYFGIRNSLCDVPPAPLFVDAVSIFVACAVEFQVGVLALEDFSVSNLSLRVLTIRSSSVCCSVCMRNGLRFTNSKHCFADDEVTALHEYRWSLMGIRNRF